MGPPGRAGGVQPDPGEGPRRGEEGRGENAVQGEHGVRWRGDPRTPRGAGHVRDVALFSEETGAVAKKQYYLHFERDLRLLWPSWSKCERGDMLGAIEIRMAQ